MEKGKGLIIGESLLFECKCKKNVGLVFVQKGLARGFCLCGRHYEYIEKQKLIKEFNP